MSTSTQSLKLIMFSGGKNAGKNGNLELLLFRVGEAIKLSAPMVKLSLSTSTSTWSENSGMLEDLGANGALSSLFS